MLNEDFNKRVKGNCLDLSVDPKQGKTGNRLDSINPAPTIIMGANNVITITLSKEESYINYITKLENFIGENPHIIKVNLKSQNLNSYHLGLLIDALKDSNIMALNLSSNQIDLAGITKLTKMPKLVYLNLSDNELFFQKEYIAELAKIPLIYLNISTTSQYLPRNRVAEDALQEIAQMTKLQTLEISGILHDDSQSLKMYASLQQLISQMPNLKCFNISHNNLPSKVGAAISQHMVNLIDLDISHNQIHNIKIIKRFGNLKNLLKLKLEQNYLEDYEVGKQIVNDIKLKASQYDEESIKRKIITWDNIESFVMHFPQVANDQISLERDLSNSMNLIDSLKLAVELSGKESETAEAP